MDEPTKESYVFGDTPTYIPEVQKNVYWECQVTDKEVRIIQRGGPLEPIILTIKGENLEVTDSWEWGCG